MRDYRDVKAMARRLREALAQRGVSLTHTDCLELIARSFGLKDWHVLAAMIEAEGDDGPTVAARPNWSGPALLLRDMVAFPKVTFPVFVGRTMSKLALTDAYQGDQEILLVTQKNQADDDPGVDAIYAVGVIADVFERTVMPAGEIKLLVRGRQRAAIVSFSVQDGFRRAEATVEAAALEGAASASRISAAMEALKTYAAGGDLFTPDLMARLAEIRAPGVLADLIAAHARLPVADKQRLLETRGPGERLAAVTRLITPAGQHAA